MITPFFTRPSLLRNQQVIDGLRDEQRLFIMNTIKKGMSSYSSPTILISRKLDGIPRRVPGLIHLYIRLVKLNACIPLVRDSIQILGTSKTQVISIGDLKDSYDTLFFNKSVPALLWCYIILCLCSIH